MGTKSSIVPLIDVAPPAVAPRSDGSPPATVASGHGGAPRRTGDRGQPAPRRTRPSLGRRQWREGPRTTGRRSPYRGRGTCAALAGRGRSARIASPSEPTDRL